MTLPVNQQNCANCFFARSMSRPRTLGGPASTATKLRLAPAQAQRFVYTNGNGWAPLLPGTLL